jgi:hypothetical protein
MNFKIAALAAFALVCGTSLVHAAELKPLKYVLCKNNQKMVRTIRITPENSAVANCRVTYAKTGLDEVVGQSRSMSDCKTILQNIQDNLAASEWSCKNVGNASISYSNAVSVQ